MNNMKSNNLKKCMYIAYTLLFISLVNLISIDVSAIDRTVTIKGNKYTFGEKSKYELTTFSGTETPIVDGTAYGSLAVSGDILAINDVDGFKAYQICSGNAVISYNVDASKLNVANTQWHIVADKTKDFDGIKLDDNIMSGTIIVQASIDGENWITEAVSNDIFVNTTTTENYYPTSDIQQVNGCYYRILIAYKTAKETTNAKGKKVTEYAKYVEEYKFYLVDSEANSSLAISPDSKPKKDLGSKIETKHDNGYANEISIGVKDPHYGWDVGQFYVNGYTRETVDSLSGDPVFLKNVGDTVTLWFNLQQDINCLNGNSKLKISDDKNGYDQYFEIDKTNMKKGTLIIRYTDFEGTVHDPVIYTNYLAANVRTGANTRVELFEEGDYEVALDYEVANESVIDSYTDYRIFFKFQIRNGNCMVYPFDVSKNKELSDGAITSNGFKLDMAKSRYLTIDVQRYSVKTDYSGYITTDERFNRPAKDGETYSDEGIYVFKVTNLYTNESTTKTIYVGSSNIIKAIANAGSVESLNGKISEGYTISDTGLLIAPVAEEPEMEEEEDVVEVVEPVDDNVSEEAGEAHDTTDSLVKEGMSEVIPNASGDDEIDVAIGNNEETITAEEIDNETKKAGTLPVVPIVAVAVLICGIIGLIVKNRNVAKVEVQANESSNEPAKVNVEVVEEKTENQTKEVEDVTEIDDGDNDDDDDLDGNEI